MSIYTNWTKVDLMNRVKSSAGIRTITRLGRTSSLGGTTYLNPFGGNGGLMPNSIVASFLCDQLEVEMTFLNMQFERLKDTPTRVNILNEIKLKIQTFINNSGLSSTTKNTLTSSLTAITDATIILTDPNGTTIQPTTPNYYVTDILSQFIGGSANADALYKTITEIGARCQTNSFTSSEKTILKADLNTLKTKLLTSTEIGLYDNVVDKIAITSSWYFA